MIGGIGGTRAACASKTTMASCIARWGGHAGRRTWGGRRGQIRGMAMSVLGSGLAAARNHEDALSVEEANLSMMRRIGASESHVLDVQSNLAVTYDQLGRDEEALEMKRDVYSGHLKLNGEQHRHTLIAANNYATSLFGLGRFEEAKSLVRKTMPVARRILGENEQLVLMMRSIYATALYDDPAATLDDLREAVSTLEDAGRTARRVLGGSHPLTNLLRGPCKMREPRSARCWRRLPTRERRARNSPRSAQSSQRRSPPMPRRWKMQRRAT